MVKTRLKTLGLTFKQVDVLVFEFQQSFYSIVFVLIVSLLGLHTLCSCTVNNIVL